MDRVGLGGVITRPATFTNGAGALVDPVDPLIAIFDPQQVQVLAPVAPVRDGLGLYHYDYAVDAAAPIGVWRDHWTATVDDAPIAADSFFEVTPAGSIIFGSAGYPRPSELGLIVKKRINDDDPHAQLLIDLAFGAIVGWSGQAIRQVLDDTVTLVASPGEPLWLPQRPVFNVSAVEIDEIVLDTDAYAWNRGGKLLGAFSAYPGTEVLVTYSHGFAKIPDSVRGATLTVAARMYRNPANLIGETIAGYNAQFRAGGNELTAFEKDQLAFLRWGSGTAS